jgi:nitrogenase molybdenum-iron protein NifN
MKTKDKEYTSTQNACKLCTPLGASLAFKGVENAITLLHGSQGCSTYIRRYMISHFREPIDIASTNFSEETAIFGGKEKFKTAINNITRQYDPDLIGIATTCLSETIGEDVAALVKECRLSNESEYPILIHVSTPSYRGTHIDGFHSAVKALVEMLAEPGDEERINIFPGMISPEDIRHLKEILKDFNCEYTLLPDYSRTLDGGLWEEYQRIPAGGTPIEDIKNCGSAKISIQFGRVLNEIENAGRFLKNKFGIPLVNLGLPIGINETDNFFSILKNISGMEIPNKYLEERERLIDSLIDGHKYVFDARAIVYGEEDFVTGIASFLDEVGIVPVLCASGGESRSLEKYMSETIKDYKEKGIKVINGADFNQIAKYAEELSPDFFIGHSKGFSSAKKLKVPLIRVGFPIHDRFGGQRILHIGYRGAQYLFDKIVNTILETRQIASPVGYSYM